MNQSFGEKLQSILDNQTPYYGDDGITRTQAKQAILELIKESVPEPYLVDVKRDDFKEAIGWNGCRTELLKQFGMEE